MKKRQQKPSSPSEPWKTRPFKGQVWTEVKSPQTLARWQHRCFFCGDGGLLLAHHMINKPDVEIVAMWDTVCVCHSCHWHICHNNLNWNRHPDKMLRRNRYHFIWRVRLRVLFKIGKNAMDYQVKRLIPKFPTFLKFPK